MLDISSIFTTCNWKKRMYVFFTCNKSHLKTTCIHACVLKNSLSTMPWTCTSKAPFLKKGFDLILFFSKSKKPNWGDIDPINKSNANLLTFKIGQRNFLKNCVTSAPLSNGIDEKYTSYKRTQFSTMPNVIFKTIINWCCRTTHQSKC